MNRRANRLAHYLRELGVKPDERVAICVERGLEMVVGLLGILKAGGAYVPLDPDYPAERLRYMLEDSGPAALLTQGHLESVSQGSARLCRSSIWTAEAPQWNRAAGDEPGTCRHRPHLAESGLCDLYLGLHGHAQGGDGSSIGRVTNLLMRRQQAVSELETRDVLQYVSFSV